jgi:TATA-box binding protein (TBP) (component of TFIID and TFIIIB)
MFRLFAHTNVSLKTLQPRNCSVSTMTVCGKLNTDVHIERVVNFLKTGDLTDYGLSSPPDSPKKRPKSFFNQLTIKSGTTSIKLFSNGSIHVTGAKSPIHFVDVMDRVCSALGHVVQADPPVLESATISMINAVFCAAKVLPLRVLRQAFEDAGHVASYDPDSYPGINAKINASETNEINRITVMIFTTGNVIISGAKSPEHVSKVYDIVCHVIDDLDVQMNDTAVPRCTSASVLDSYRISNGYSSRIANLCNQ